MLLTTIAQPGVEVGQASVRLLLQQIGGESGQPARIVLPTALIERESCQLRFGFRRHLRLWHNQRR